jgi:hypothetical protein
MFRPRRGKAASAQEWLVDRMTDPPLNNFLHGCRRAGVTWLAFVALLGNVLLPTALSIFVLKEPGSDFSGVVLCGHWPSDAPGKAKPGLLVQHCPLCAVPTAPLPRPPSIAVADKLADESPPQFLTTAVVAPIQHGRMQARAPPSVV